MVTAIIDTKGFTNDSEKLEKDVLNFLACKKSWNDLTKKMAKLKDKIAITAKSDLEKKSKTTGTVTYLVDDRDGIKISIANDFKIIDEKMLQDVLGDSYIDLVTEKTTYRAEPKLKEMFLELSKDFKNSMEIVEKTPTIAMVTN